MNQKVTLLRKPDAEDWMRCYRLALATQGKRPLHAPTDQWRAAILKAEHSPIRTLMWTIEMENIPYYVSVHLCRHKIGVEHYVSSQRGDFHRGDLPQDAPVTHIMDINAAALIAMARKRLCLKADANTRALMMAVQQAVWIEDSVMGKALMPSCKYQGELCPEMSPCGRFTGRELM